MAEEQMGGVVLLREEGVSWDLQRKMGRTAGFSDDLDLSLPLDTTWQALWRMRKRVSCRDGLDLGGEQDRGTLAVCVQFTWGPRRAFKSKK